MKKITIISFLAITIILGNYAYGMHSSNPYGVQSMTLAYVVRTPLVIAEITVTNRTDKPIIIESQDFLPEKRISVAPRDTVPVTRKYWGIGRDRVLMIKQNNQTLEAYFNHLYTNKLGFELAANYGTPFNRQEIALDQPAQPSAYQGMMMMVPVATSTTNLKGELVVEGDNFEKSSLNLHR
jgi:hypothetical protein